MQIHGLLFLLLSPALASAASFNCVKAATAVEKLICGSPQLSLWDEELAAAYNQAADQARDKAPLALDQKRWLKNERGVCRDENCLKKAYQDRLGELRRWHEAVPEDKDIFGSYSIQRDNFILNPRRGTAEPVKTEDCLTLRPSKEGTLHFSFVLVGGNGHTCNMEGEAVLFGSVYRFIPDVSDPDVPKDCMLHIRIKRNTIALEDPDGACRAYFCGVRAVIDGVEFARRQKVSKECEQP